jgi:signal transduction histidine kinase/ActR/RegA family two-component response regulator/HAMP domain-containing protein
MGSLRDLRLKWRITLAVFLASTLVAGVVLSLVIWFGSAQVQRDAREIAVKTAQENASTASAIIRNVLVNAHNLANTFVGLKAAGRPDRAQIEEILKAAIQNNPDMIGVWTVWEPNALDGRDKEFANTAGHDGTGRFIPYWTYIDGIASRETLVGYDKDGEGDYYLVPKRTGKSSIIGPYKYKVRGKDILMVSLCVPIFIDGKFVGVAGFDVSAERLQAAVSRVRPYGTGYGALLTTDSIYAAHPDAKKVLTPLLDVDDIEHVKGAVRNGTLTWVVEHSKTLNDEAIKVYAPLRMGDITTSWSLEVVAPMSTLMKPVYLLTRTAILLSILTVLASTFVAYGIGRSIALPITRTAEGITAIADGDTNQVIEDLDCTNEIGALAQATHRLRNAVIDSIRLSNIVKTLPGAIYEIYTPNFESRGTMTYLSTGILSKTGYSAEEIREDVDILKPFQEHMYERRKVLREALQNDGRFESIWEFIRKDGTRGCFLERGTITPGSVEGYNIAGILIDYTAAREAEEQLKDSRSQLQDVVVALDRADEAISISYPFHEIVYANRSFAVLFADGNPENVIGRRMADLIVSTDPPFTSSISGPMAEAISSGTTFAQETSAILAKDRSTHIISWTVSPLADGRLLNVTRDITERRNQEQREDQLRSQLVEAQKMESIGRLAGGVAHDFNNILGAVRTFASLISDDSSDGSNAQKFANRIISTCDRAADIVRQILVFARASQSELAPLRLLDVIEEVRSYLSASIPQRIPLRVELPTPNDIIVGNAGQLIQMIMNLGVNARDAIGEENGEVQILTEHIIFNDQDVLGFKMGYSELQTRHENCSKVCQFVVGAALPHQRYLKLTVRDNGPGVSGPTLKRMFEPFFTTKEKARGTGLGLSVVAAVTTAHTGFIAVTTDEGRGCRFSIYLPMTTGVIESKTPLTMTNDLRGTERVLLIDDEADLADAISLALRKLGYSADPHYNPKEALAKFASSPDAWDVIITDQVMPEMKGLELIERVKKIRADIPVIMCTGYSDNTTERRAVITGASAFFIKPVQTETLAAAIRKVRSNIVDLVGD